MTDLRRPRRALEDALAKLTARLAGHELPGVNGHGDAYDHAQHEVGRQEAFRDRARLLTDIAETTAALERIAAGTYGECESCGNAIAPKRVEALPTVRTCVSCQEKAERAEAELRRAGRRRIDDEPGEGC